MHDIKIITKSNINKYPSKTCKITVWHLKKLTINNDRNKKSVFGIQKQLGEQSKKNINCIITLWRHKNKTLSVFCDRDKHLKRILVILDSLDLNLESRPTSKLLGTLFRCEYHSCNKTWKLTLACCKCSCRIHRILSCTVVAVINKLKKTVFV